jgi:hypothetical protein
MTEVSKKKEGNPENPKQSEDIEIKEIKDIWEKLSEMQ